MFRKEREQQKGEQREREQPFFGGLARKKRPGLRAEQQKGEGNIHAEHEGAGEQIGVHQIGLQQRGAMRQPPLIHPRKAGGLRVQQPPAERGLQRRACRQREQQRSPRAL